MCIAAIQIQSHSDDKIHGHDYVGVFSTTRHYVLCLFALQLSRQCQFQHNEKLSGIMQSWVDLPIGNETAMQLAVDMVGPLAAAVDARPISFQV